MHTTLTHQITRTLCFLLVFLCSAMSAVYADGDAKHSDNRHDDQAPAAKKGRVLATINGETITAVELAAAIEEISDQSISPLQLAQTSTPELHAMIKGMLTHMHLLQMALNDPELQTRLESDAMRKILERNRQNIIIADYLARQVEASITPEDIKARYEALVTTAEERKTYHIKHIITTSEDEADKAFTALAGGTQTFASVATQYSIDPTVAENGGDLGHMIIERMHPSFSDTIKNLEVGEYSQPVQSNAGFHILHLVAIADEPVPTFEEAAPIIIDQLRTKNRDVYISTLIPDEVIEIK